MKKSFIENQEKLNKLLVEPNNEPCEPYFIDLKDDDEPYTVTESSEPMKKFAGKAAFMEGLTIEEIIPSIKTPIINIDDKNSRVEQKNVLHSLMTKKFCCDICDYQVLKKAWLLNHQWKVHNGPMPSRKHFVCEICSKQFNKSEYLRRHLDRHNNVKRYICGK